MARERHGVDFSMGLWIPVAKMVAQELSEKLETAVSLDLSALHASDIQGRARSFKSLVDGGMPIAEAVSLTGLLVEDS